MGSRDPNAGFQVQIADTTLSEATIVLRKRRWVLILALLLGFLIGMFRSWTQPRLFTATGEIQVRPGASAQYRVDGPSMGAVTDTTTRLQTEVAILQSDSLAESVARELDLANDPAFLNATGPVPHRNLEDNNGAVREKIIRTLHKNLLVVLVPHTDLIRISYSSLNGKLSANIVNTVINDYITRSYQTRYASTQRVSEWLSGTLSDLKQEVETSQEQLMELSQPLGVNTLDPSHNQISSDLEDLSKAADDARVARMIAEARYRVLSSNTDTSGIEGLEAANYGTNPTLLSQLRAQRATLETELAQQSVELGPNHPEVKQLRAQIAAINTQMDQEQSRLLQQAKTQLNAAVANENMTEAALEAEKEDAYKLRDNLIQYQIRQREFDSNRTLYEGLLERLRTAGVEAGLESSEIDIVDVAMIPATPTITPRSDILMFSMLFALLGGVIIAFLMESLDTGLRSIAEIESITELPSLAIIPRARKVGTENTEKLTIAQRNISVLTQPKSHFAESFRALRTSLLLSTTGKPPKIILVTSATPAEGKTTTATNIAAVLAQRDTRVLLIDSDLRRPTVHHRFGLVGKTGLTTVLNGTMTLENAVQHVPEIPNLDILPSGPVPPFPTEMLGSEVMVQLLHHCAGIYSHIVIDSPPILSVTDGVILARHADAVVLVVRHGKSSKHVVRRARDLLARAGAPVTGIVLNAVDLSSPEYYGYYGYSGFTYYGVDSTGWETSQGGDTGKEKD
ncbi:MAG TPA: polysaccharide biosynthesis tyrosine autokinase [Acidobacteriaceae bacterium]|nr:polysaccharide biosynthesis tyrosine autokinase [Acidobacteriaceae bacterium]